MDVRVEEGLPPDLGFSVAVPRGWNLERQPVEGPPGPDDPVMPIARFLPGGPDSLGGREGMELVLWAVYLPREIHGWDWLRSWIVSQGFEPIDARQVATQYGIMGDALAMRTRDGLTRLHRLATFKDGDLIYLVDGRVPVRPDLDVDRAQEVFLMAVQRFGLLTPTRQKLAEAFEWVTLGGAGGPRLLVSGLWRRRPAGDVPDGGDALVIENPLEDGVAGTMVVVLGGAGDDPVDLEETTVAKLANNGVVLAAAAGPVSEHAEGARRVSIVERLGTHREVGVTALCARAVISGRPVSVLLLTPGADGAFDVWSVNRRAFEIAVNSLGMPG